MLSVRSRTCRSMLRVSDSRIWARRVVCCSQTLSDRASMLLYHGSQHLRLQHQKPLHTSHHLPHLYQVMRNGNKSCHRKHLLQSS